MIRLLEDVGATWRIVRLVRSDKVTQGLRDRARVVDGKLSQLIECPYCLGVWAATLVLLMRRLHLGWLVRLLAVAAVAGELAAQLDEEPG